MFYLTGSSSARTKLPAEDSQEQTNVSLAYVHLLRSPLIRHHAHVKIQIGNRSDLCMFDEFFLTIPDLNFDKCMIFT